MNAITESKRLVLRYFQQSDLISFHTYRNDSLIFKYQSWSLEFSKIMAEKFILSQMNSKIYDKNKWIQIALEHKSSNAHIGDVAFINFGQYAEIGYTISRPYQYLGLGTEAVSSLLTLLFKNIKIHRVVAITDFENSSSIKLLTKLGFRQEGHHRLSYYDDKMNLWRDEYYFALLNKEWTID